MLPYLIYAILYVVGLPLLVWFFHLLHKKLVFNKKMERFQKEKTADAKPPMTLLQKMNKHLRFTRANTQQSQLPTVKKGSEPKMIPGQPRFIYWGIYVAGFLLSLGAGILKMPMLFLIGVCLFFGSIIYSKVSSKKPMERREKLYRKMAEVASIGLGAPTGEAMKNPEGYVNVTKWANPLQPTEIKLPIPKTFNHMNSAQFLEKFNQFFGRTYTWVTNGDEGWDYEEDIVTLSAVPPLPKIAPWSEHYILSKDIAPSFFPIALGSENGVELENPNTGKKENVLGFDVQGAMLKKPYKRDGGPKIGPEISASPQGLVGGGTGGGKAFAVTTPIRYFVKKSSLTPKEDRAR